MASELIELGASELIELGRFNRVRWDGLHGLGEVEERQGGVLGLFRAVDRLEDPTSTVKKLQNQKLKPGQKAISERIRTISRYRRVRRVSPGSMPNRLFGTDEEEEAMEGELGDLSRSLSGLASTRSGIAPLLSEARRMSSHPALISALGIVSSRVPAVQKYMASALEGVTRMHVRSRQEIAEAFAVASAAEPAYVGALDGLPTSARGSMKRMLGEARRDLAGAGAGSAYVAAMKYLGGLAAVQSLFDGCGHECGCDDCGCGKNMKGLWSELRGNADFCAAEALGEQDLVNKAAGLGVDPGTAQSAIDTGRPSDFPVIPVVIGVTAVGIGIGLLLWLF